MDIASTLPWPLTQGHQFLKGSSQFGKQPFSENRVQIGTSFRLEFCSQENIGHTHRHTYTHRNKLQWKYNPSTISWRCKNSSISIWVDKVTVNNYNFFVFLEYYILFCFSVAYLIIIQLPWMIYDVWTNTL